MKRYRPPPYAGRITLFRSAAAEGEPDLGWKEWADDVEVVAVPGDHFSMVREPHAATLAGELSRRLVAASVLE